MPGSPRGTPWRTRDGTAAAPNIPRASGVNVHGSRASALAALGLAAIAPLFLAPGGNLLHNMVLAAPYVVMALGLNVIVGFAGLLDLGYVAFFAIGGYTAAYLASGYCAGADVSILAGDSVAGTPGIHLNFLLVLALAAAATAAAGALIGVPTLRLRGDYIAVVTLASARSSGRSSRTGAASSCSAER